MSKSGNEAEATRLMLLGLMTEATAEEQAAFAAAKREIDELIERHGDIGKVALAVAMAEVASKE